MKAQSAGNPESLSANSPCTSSSARAATDKDGHVTTDEQCSPVEDAKKSKLLPRETGHDIGMGSPVPLSSEAVGVITRLRNMKVSYLHFVPLSTNCMSLTYFGLG